MSGSRKKVALIGAAVIVAIISSSIFYWTNISDRFLSYAENQKKIHFSLELVEGKTDIVPFLVLGSGPASLSAALYGARSKVKTVVLRGNKPGGQLTGTSYIENWPGVSRIKGPEIMNDFEKQVVHFGAQMVNDAVVSIDFSQWPYLVKTEEGHVIYAMALFIGMGATPRKLNVPGEQEYWGKGVTTCAICDAPYHKDHRVLVIGGGDTAVEECFELAAYAKEVIMVVRTDTLRAAPQMLDRLKNYDNVKIVFNTSLTSINGDGSHVHSVDVIHNETKEKTNWDNIRGVFLAIGHQPNTIIFENQLELTPQKYIKTEGFKPLTSQPGVFAAGDIIDDRYRQAGVAAGDGIKAGLEAVWWLTGVGYDQKFEEKYEPFFFNSSALHKKDVEQVNSVVDLEDMMRTHKNKIFVLDFYTKQCPACLHMFPVVQWVGTKMQEKVIFVKVDGNIAFDLVKKYKVPQVPYFVVIKKGVVVGSTGDVMDRREMYTFAHQYCD